MEFNGEEDMKSIDTLLLLFPILLVSVSVIYALSSSNKDEKTRNTVNILVTLAGIVMFLWELFFIIEKLSK